LYRNSNNQNKKKLKTVTRSTTIPENSAIASDFDKIDYCDTFRVVKATNDSAEQMALEIFKLPNWVKPAYFHTI